MTSVFPLFCCCKHGEMTFEVIRREGCCWHTRAFRSKKVVTKEDRKDVKWCLDFFRHNVRSKNGSDNEDFK